MMRVRLKSLVNPSLFVLLLPRAATRRLARGRMPPRAPSRQVAWGASMSSRTAAGALASRCGPFAADAAGIICVAGEASSTPRAPSHGAPPPAHIPRRWAPAPIRNSPSLVWAPFLAGYAVLYRAMVVVAAAVMRVVAVMRVMPVPRQGCMGVGGGVR